MSSAVYLFIIVLATILSIPLLILKVFSLEADISLKQFELMKKIVQDAVAYVNQVSLDEDFSSEEKKQRAIEVATTLATTFNLSKKYFDSFSELIESVLWNEEDPSLDDDEDDEDELM